jgi:hypothetical protein
MTADVLRAFDHEHNALEVARQDYEMAKQHVDEILRLDWRQRNNCQDVFRAAVERRDAARKRFVALLVG